MGPSSDSPLRRALLGACCLALGLGLPVAVRAGDAAAVRDGEGHPLHAALVRPGSDLVRGAHGVGEGIDPSRADEMVAKFWPDGLLVVRAGGPAGLFSAICAGWTGGRNRHESQPVTREILT